MPNAKVLSEKQAIVAELTEKLKTASSGVLVDYKGITVAQDTALRAECRKNDLDYAPWFVSPSTTWVWRRWIPS